MTNDIIYKVLWVDDDTSIIAGYQTKAEGYNIDLCPVNNWQEAQKLLKDNFKDYSAIILDAECKMNAEDPEECGFINKVLMDLNKFFGKKQVDIPWYILSAGTMDGFESVMNDAQYSHKEFDEEWGYMVYSKTAPSFDSNSADKLFENIQRVASNQISNKVLARYQDTFQYLGEGQVDRQQGSSQHHAKDAQPAPLSRGQSSL